MILAFLTFISGCKLLIECIFEHFRVLGFGLIIFFNVKKTRIFHIIAVRLWMIIIYLTSNIFDFCILNDIGRLIFEVVWLFVDFHLWHTWCLMLGTRVLSAVICYLCIHLFILIIKIYLLRHLFQVLIWIFMHIVRDSAMFLTHFDSRFLPLAYVIICEARSSLVTQQFLKVVWVLCILNIIWQVIFVW